MSLFISVAASAEVGTVKAEHGFFHELRDLYWRRDRIIVLPFGCLISGNLQSCPQVVLDLHGA